MSLRLALICLSLLVLVAFVPLPTAGAPQELASGEYQLIIKLLNRKWYKTGLPAEGNVDLDVEPSAPPADESTKPQQRTFFLLLPLLFPDQFYFS